LIFLAIGGWWLWRKLRRSGRRRQTTAAVGVGAVVLTIAAALTLANSYFSYLPRVRDVTNVVAEERNWPTYNDIAQTSPAVVVKKWPNGVVVHLDIPDRGSGFGNTEALVWLPPQYFSDAGQRFPVVYLFHGSPGVPGDWMRGGQAPQAAMTLARAGHPVIVVSPRMSHGWLDDPECVDGVHEKVETHLLGDVIPTVDSSLRTLADRTHRTFGGMSAGGYCALNLGLRNRSVASTIIDMSGFTKPTHTGGLSELFGSPSPAEQSLVKANSPAEYAATLAAGPPTRVWMDVGTEDKGVMDEMTPVVLALRSRGVDVVYRVRTGAHTFYVWAPALVEALPWSQGLPSGDARSNPSTPGPEALPVGRAGR
jgi:enterochelin esterase-like enzyme